MKWNCFFLSGTLLESMTIEFKGFFSSKVIGFQRAMVNNGLENPMQQKVRKFISWQNMNLQQRRWNDNQITTSNFQWFLRKLSPLNVCEIDINKFSMILCSFEYWFEWLQWLIEIVSMDGSGLQALTMLLLRHTMTSIMISLMIRWLDIQMISWMIRHTVPFTSHT